MKRISFILGLLALCASCENDTDGNKTLDYDTIEVNFSASIVGKQFAGGAEIGVIATCNRGEDENVSMSTSQTARFTARTSGERADIFPLTDDDKVVAKSGDHNYNFYGIYPCPSEPVDLENMSLGVPAVQEYGTDCLTYLASRQVLTVIPTVELEMKPIFSVIELYIPNDLREDEVSVLKSLEVTPADAAAFSGHLAPFGVYNAVTGEFNADEATSSDKITISFGEGLRLTEPFTKVEIVTAPFTVPDGGFSVKFLDADGTMTETAVLSSDKETGTVLAAGKSISAYVSSVSDGIVPVSFPVVFPLGYPDDDNTKTGYCNAVNGWMAEWVNDPACASATRLTETWNGQHGKVYCYSQNQAYVTWNWADGIKDTGIKYFIETANTARLYISTFGVKGVWTGDYFEFTVPVRKFEAGSQLQLTMPIYTRIGPVFWEVLYKDGDAWKTTAKENLPAYDGADVTATATWALPFGGAANTTEVDTDQSVIMKFENAVKSGIINIRVKCVDGAVVCSAENTVTTVTAPTNSKGNASAPFYFWNPAPSKRTDQSIRIEKL